MTAAIVPAPGYAELMAQSNFSFLEGASHPDELVLAARAQGLAALALTDRNTLAGVVRAHRAAKAHGLRLVVGCRLDLTDGGSFLCYPTDRAAYGRLCRLLSAGKLRAPKGQCHLARADLFALAEGQLLVALPPVEAGVEETGGEAEAAFAARLATDADALAAAGARLHLGAAHLARGDDLSRIDALAALAAARGLPLVALGDVRYHAPTRKPLADLLACIRLGRVIDTAGFALAANADRHLKAPAEMARRFRRQPQAIANGLALAAACRFGLEELRYEYPDEIAFPGLSPQETLERRTWEGARERYPEGIPGDVRRRLIHELRLIQRLGYAPYFLTAESIVRFARSRGILCQGRGSAANSAVCYVLGVTSVDPARIDLLFERFVSAARDEPPDIDIDFEHERREEVIQHIYARYGRERAGLAATVIHYRPRSALRDVGKAMGLSADLVGRIAGALWGSGEPGSLEARARAAGLDPAEPRLAATLALAEELVGFPRHLSQHVGGFVITRGPLVELAPVANAAMAGRTTIEWDKDDIEALGILKVDVLALGMLTCLRKAFALLERHHGRRLSLGEPPAEDAAVYDMICRADTIGVFQIESRAQMSMLPRLQPRTFYDLVIEVAIVRPGPIQGDMVRPYLRRRTGAEPVSFPSAALERVLGRTLGVPLFQEQAMQIAIVAAGFTAEEADRLRRAMATFRRGGVIHRFRDQFIGGMTARGYDADFAARCFRQIEGFGTYGFPESHAASFALLVYDSAWIKHHYPAVFAAALLNSQPMGFYAPAQIVRDAAAHGVVLRPPDVNHSQWDCTLEPCAGSAGGVALRLGLRLAKGLGEAEIGRLVAARARGNGAPFASPAELARRAGLGRAAIETLARADAFGSLGLPRRAALWQAGALEPAPLPLFAAADATGAAGASDGEGTALPEPAVTLPAMTLGEEVVEDYARLHLSLKAHPCALLRPALARLGAAPAARLAGLADGARVRLGGLVLVRQRPGSASGVTFVTLEDETATANLVVMPDRFERYRAALLGARLLLAEGRVERVEYGAAPVIHLRALRLEDHSALLDTLHAADAAPPAPAPWDAALARADEGRNPGRGDPRPARRAPAGAEGGAEAEAGEPARLAPEAAPRRAAGRFLPPSRDFH